MSDINDLCHSCKTITFNDLENGFTHPLTYEQNLVNGRFCRFCRLMVCSFSKLQVPQNIYEVEQNYSTLISQLRIAQSVSRGSIYDAVFEHLQRPPKHLQWQPIPSVQGGLQKGTFCDGATIQVSAPDESLYLRNGHVRTREILAADSERNFIDLHEWLGNCIKYHEECRVSFSGAVHDEQRSLPRLPQRIIHVGSVDRSTSPRLEEGGGRRSRYLTLSHRWGKGELSFTTRSTLAGNKRVLHLDNMPRTFRDAIHVTRRLGLSYIWIDALCIVQDDPDEWRKQSIQMGSIFERSTCTLAAVDALENDECEDNGLFLARPANPLSVQMNIPLTKSLARHVISRVAAFKGYQCVWKIKWLTAIAGPKSTASSRAERLDTAISHHRLVLRPRILSSYFRMNKSAWAHRGWVMQERFLSRRVIYFTKDKLYWDCLKVSEDEEHAESLGSPPRAMGSKISGTVDRRRKAWEFIVYEYSSTVLTYSRDKLAALMGLTSSFKKRFSSQNHVGIDGDTTGFGLLWHAKDTYLNIYSDYHAPSWTWAAYDGPVSYYCAVYADSHRPLASQVEYRMNFSCPYQNSRKHEEDSLCSWGLVSLEAPIGITYTCGKRIYDEPTLQSDSELLPIVGKSIYIEQKPIPRYNQNGQLEALPRTLSLPKHTEILFDENGRYNGWFIRDVEPTRGFRNDFVPLHFVAIGSWEQDDRQGQDIKGAFDPDDNANEICVDILLLKPTGEDQPYSRIGRGRLIMNAWPDHVRHARMDIL